MARCSRTSLAGRPPACFLSAIRAYGTLARSGSKTRPRSRLRPCIMPVQAIVFLEQIEMMKPLAILIICSVMFGLAIAGQSANSETLLILPFAKAHHLGLINPRTNTVEDTIAVSGWPHEVAFSSDGRTAYVSSYSDTIVGKPGFDGQSIDVVDMQTRKATGTLDLQRPLRPHMPMISKDGKLLVSAELAQSILIVDPTSGKIGGVS